VGQWFAVVDAWDLGVSQPVRVVRIITRLNVGGPSIQAINLSRELATEGFETCLIHGHLAPGEGDMTTFLTAGGIETVYVDTLVRSISPINDLRAFWRIYRVLQRWQPDIVHTHQAKAGALGRLAALLYNWRRPARIARLIHTYHGHVFEGYFGTPSTRVFLFVERWLARRTDTLIAISRQVQQDLLHTYAVAKAEQVSVIPLGFDLDRLLRVGAAERQAARAELGVADGAIVVATVGRLTEIKQHTLFLDMASRLAAQSERFVFLIVGDGELRGALEAQARHLGIADRTRFLGWRGDLQTIYGATDVFVLTSRNEGTPVALIEAMASGVSSVSTDVGGVRDVITGPDVGCLVPFGNPAALADAVWSLAQDSAGRDAVGMAARESVRQRFHGVRLRRDITTLYRRLMTTRSTITRAPR